jgi:hypothetical protein
VLSKKSELKACEAIADIFDGARPEAKPLGHYLQAATQLHVTFLDMVSNFSTLEWCNHRVGNPTPGYPLPFLQLGYFVT